ncbi:MAG TPA: FadD3 family acyl-CoA ligase [Streptosporangiaceae bacterium]
MDARTVPGLLREAARRYGGLPALADGPVRLTFAGLAAEAAAVARALAGHGVRPGDRVAVWAPNTAYWVLAALGAHTAGAVLVPVNTRFTGAEAADVLRRSRARLLFAADGFLGIDYLGMVRAARPALPGLRTVVACAPHTAAPDALEWPRFLSAAPHAAPPPAVRPGDVADVMFTSGTTGRSKGAVSAHRQTVGVARAWADAAGVRPGDRYLIVSPFFHTFGYKAGIVACLAAGAAIVPQPVFDVAETVRLVGAEEVTVLPGPPTIYQSILDAPDRGAVRMPRVAVTGAASVPVRLVERMRAELGFATVLTAYGLTEAVVVTMSRPGDDPRTIATTCGRATAGFEIRICGPDGGELPPGADGEVRLRGPNVMLGYLDDPAATADAFDPGGWLRTGDIGRLDAAGYLTITDRLKDMLTVGGFNVYPAEVEQVLARHDGVAEAAVVGVADRRLGEVPKAYVVARPGAAPAAADLVAFCRERLAGFKVPRTVEFLPELPRNAGGKVLKRELRR